MRAAVECNNLTKKFGSFTAVDDLSLNVSPGSVVGFLGPNGAGKSTSILMMVGLSIPSAGTVRLFGADPRAQKTRECLGYVPGELRLDERPTVRETLASWGGYGVGWTLPIEMSSSSASQLTRARKWEASLQAIGERLLWLAP